MGPLGSFERAALETLGAEVVVPVLRDGSSSRSPASAGKRSGDIIHREDGTTSPCSRTSSAACSRDSIGGHARPRARRCSPPAPLRAGRRGRARARGRRARARRARGDRAVRGHPWLQRASTRACARRRRLRHAERAHRARVRDRAGVRRHHRRVQRRRHDGGVRRARGARRRRSNRRSRPRARSWTRCRTALAVGVGVATGQAFVGSIRSTDRLIWSAVGSTTNLASRLQS